MVLPLVTEEETALPPGVGAQSSGTQNPVWHHSSLSFRNGTSSQSCRSMVLSCGIQEAQQPSFILSHPRPLPFNWHCPCSCNPIDFPLLRGRPTTPLVFSSAQAFSLFNMGRMRIFQVFKFRSLFIQQFLPQFLSLFSLPLSEGIKTLLNTSLRHLLS